MNYNNSNAGFGRQTGASAPLAADGAASLFHRGLRSFSRTLLHTLGFSFALTLSAQQAAQAQSFSDMSGTAPLAGVAASSMAWGDYDGDNDLDLLIAGRTIVGTGYKAKIYTNLGNGKFSELGVSLHGRSDGTAAWGDYDGDGDLDVLLTGWDGGNGTGGANIYTNNGNGNFSLLPIYFSENAGAAAWGDYDNDGDLDVFMLGRFFEMAHLYVNKGGGVFEQNASATAQVTPGSDGTVAWGDYDNDGDLDLLTEGLIAGSGAEPRLYNNDNGIFVAVTVPTFRRMREGNIAWGDYDNDGDLDILHTGKPEINSGDQVTAMIYKNNGGATFAPLLNTGLTLPATYGAWGDSDNDGDLDVILQGVSGSSKYTRVYLNNGNDTFSQNSSFLVGMRDGSLAWGDYDRDGDLDVVVSGYTYTEQTKLYRNNSTPKNVVPSAPSNLTAAVNGTEVTFNWSASADSKTPSAALTYNLYVGTVPQGNQKMPSHSQNFTGYRRIVSLGNAQHGTSFTLKNLPGGTYYWSVQAVDHSFAGSAFAPEKNFTINVNLPKPVITSFTPGKGTFGEGVVIKGENFNDVTEVRFNGKLSTDWGYNDSDELYAVVPVDAGTGKISVTTPAGIAISQQDFNYVAPVFVETPASLPGVIGDMTSGDYDNDGDLDILLIGYSTGYPSYTVTTKLYINNGGFGFTEHTSANLLPLQIGVAAFGDYDNDNDLDILLSGRTVDYKKVTKIYTNNGGIFSELTTANLMGVDEGSVDWGDFNNDGKLDILLTGNPGNDEYVSKIYKNNGNGTFTELASAGLMGVYISDAKWFDYDNDNDLDIVLSGADVYYTSHPVTKIYTNNGNETFTELPTSLLGVTSAALAVGDYDGDQDMDLLVTGGTYDNNISNTILYRNDGGGNFSDSGVNLISVMGGKVSFGNYDNDDDLDILISGLHMNDDGSGGNTLVVYSNLGDGTFEPVPMGNTALTRSNYVVGMFGDYDNDKDLDLAITGEFYAQGRKMMIYNNVTSRPNFVPEAPRDLTASVTGNDVMLNWFLVREEYHSDEGGVRFPSNITYNIYVKRADGSFVVSPQSSLVNGYHRVADYGNAEFGTSFSLKGLAAGTYYWSVQSVDDGFVASAFAAEGTFTIGTTAPLCATPSNLQVSEVTRVSANASWSEVPGVYYYTVRLREVGGTDWRILNPTVANASLINLLPGKTYEWQVKTRCNRNTVIESDFSALKTFTTAACPMPVNLQTLSIADSTATFSWDAIADVTYYTVRFRALNSSVWRVGIVYTNSFNATFLVPNQTYEWQVKARCNAYSLSESAFSASVRFTTRATAGGRVEVAAHQGADRLLVYPNPAKGEVNIELLSATHEKMSELYIYNATGKLVYSQSFSKQMSPKVTMAAGMYVAKVVANGKVLTQKFIVE